MTTKMNPPSGGSFLAPGILDGRVAFITGAGTGLGRAMALRFAGLGARIGLTGRRDQPLADVAETIGSAGGNATWVTCDVRNPNGVQEAIDEVVDDLGPLDILVNNAAGNFLCPSEELSPNAFAAVVDIVLKGTFHASQSAARHWIDTGRPGAILNIATTYAWTGSAFVLPSACAKAGVVSMTRSLAVEWARYGIRVNGIAPGPIPTREAFARLLPTEELAEARRRKIPAGRFGNPEELADLAAFMVSPAAEWMRGEIVTLDGGEWLRGAGEFNDLLDLPAKYWEQLRAAREK